jgi:uncharacterized protein (UPF0333 family)
MGYYIGFVFIVAIASFVAGCVYKAKAIAAEQKAKDAIKKAASDAAEYIGSKL